MTLLKVKQISSMQKKWYVWCWRGLNSATVTVSLHVGGRQLKYSELTLKIASCQWITDCPSHSHCSNLKCSTGDRKTSKILHWNERNNSISTLKHTLRGVWCFVVSIPHPRGLLSEIQFPLHVRHSWCWEHKLPGDGKTIRWQNEDRRQKASINWFNIRSIVLQWSSVLHSDCNKRNQYQ